MFLMIEGIDAVGKTTLARKLCLHLNKYKKTYYTDQFDTAYGAQQKALFLNQEESSVDDRIRIIRECRARWINEKVRTKNLSKVHLVVDRYYLSLMAYQGLEGVIPINSDAFEEERDIAKQLHYTSIMLYIRSTNPRKMIQNPRDFIEKRSPEWHESLQDRYDLLFLNHAPSLALAIDVDEKYNYSHTFHEIYQKIIGMECNLLDEYGARRLNKKLKAHHIYSCMRKAKKQRKLPF